MADHEKRQGKGQTPPAADTIKKHIPFVQFRMDFMRDPEDALFKWGYAENGRYERWYRGNFEKLVSIVAQATGADPEQIANKDTRTPEQQRLLTEAAARQMLARMDAFFKSVYMDALTTLEPMQGVYPDPAAAGKYDPASEEVSLKEQAVLYFFAAHDEITPTECATLTDAQRDELKGIFTRLDAFYMERTNGGEITPDGAAILLAFIEKENPTPEAAESIVEKLPLVQNIRPTAHTMPNNALMNTLQQKPAINAGAFDMVVSNAKGKRKEITAYTMIEFDPGETGIKITDAKLSEYERQVSDAVVSLWVEAIKEELPAVFTPDMIYRAMPGGGDKASPQQRGAITKTIEKFRRLHITVDATDEMRKRGIIGDDETFTVDDYYLSATRARHTVKNGGQTVNAYRINTEPIMLTYCKMTGQLLTVPVKCIELKKVKGGKASLEPIKMNADRQAMAGYIIRRIKVMQHDEAAAKERKRSYDRRRAKNKELEEKPMEAFREQSRVILFDTLFKDAGLEGQSRDKAMDNRDFCFQVLDYETAIDFIKGYNKQTKGRSIAGIEILL